MRKILPRTVMIPPPAIMKEVTAGMILQGVLNGRRWIPECRPGWLGGFELRWMLTQDDAPEAWR